MIQFYLAYQIVNKIRTTSDFRTQYSSLPSFHYSNNNLAIIDLHSRQYERSFQSGRLLAARQLLFAFLFDVVQCRPDFVCKGRWLIIFDNVCEFFLNPGGHIFRALVVPLVIG
jgi:hypothetical protein